MWANIHLTHYHGSIQQLFFQTIDSFCVLFAVATAEQVAVAQLFWIAKISSEALFNPEHWSVCFHVHRPGWVCISGPVSGGDVHENVWPGTPELLPLLVQLFWLWGESSCSEGSLINQHFVNVIFVHGLSLFGVIQMIQDCRTGVSGTNVLM